MNKNYYYLSVSGANTVRKDQSTLLQKLGGGGCIGIGNSKHGCKILRNLLLLRDLFRFLLRKFHKNDVLFVLLPYTQRFKTLMYLMILLKHIKLIIITIDLDKFRDKDYNDWLEKRIYRKASAVIAQTESMKYKMLEYGYVTTNTQLYIGNLWTILSDNDTIKNTDFGKTLAFCGNFSKEPFMTRLTELGKDFRFNVYCSHGKKLAENYGLCFHKSDGIARRINDIQGDWGLVWEGCKLETCTGTYREYLKIVFSYKASLYIAANIPLIVWSESAIASFVNENHLGIVLDSLFELQERIMQLSDDDKYQIRINVKRWSEIVRSGSDRIALFNEICYEI